MAKFNVSMSVDLRFIVEVEAESFAEAFEKAELGDVDMNCFDEWVSSTPVNAEHEGGEFADYNCHPYPDERCKND